MRKQFFYLKLLLLLPIVAYGGELESKGTVTVVIKNFRNDKGEIKGLFRLLCGKLGFL